MSRVSVGIASVVAAGAAGFGAQAQEQKPAAEATPLPPLEVTTQKSAAKKAKPKKAAASSTAAPTPQGPSAPAAAPPPPTPSEQLGLTPPSGNSLQGGTGLGRLPGTLQDTPQTANVVSQEIIQQQKITTLDQALKNVPGVTVAIGEGGGGMNGDQFRIRGFQAKSDIYLDGLRDFGVYVRDSFAYEEVQVLKGPSSESFGMGTTGGVINTISKTASRGNWVEIDGSYGNGPYYRSTFDINKQIDAHTAFRFYGMINEQDIVGRDYSEADRWGLGASLAFGLGTETKWALNYYYQHGDRTPDYGVPVIPVTGGGPSKTNVAIPITEYAIPRDYFYGKDTDHDITDVHIATSKFSSELQPGLKFYNDSRLAFYSRDFASGPAECSLTNPNLAGDPVDATHNCLVDFQNGLNPPMNLGGGNPAFLQDSWGIQNLASVVAKFNTGGLHHELVAGVDAFYQEDERTQVTPFSTTTGLPTTRGTTYIRTPIYNSSGYYLAANPLGLGTAANNNGRKEADARDIAAFLSERVWLSKEWSILAGTRYDDYRASFRYWCNLDGKTGGLVTATDANAPCVSDDAWSQRISSTERFWSPKASLIWEPTKYETYYVSWARSTTPAGASITNDVSSIGDGSTTADPKFYGVQIPDPEENESWEVGGKISLLDGKLGLTGALFRVDKSNQTYTDNVGNAYQTGEEVRVQGVELGIAGSVTKEWMLQAAYAYLDGETRSGTNKGNKAPGVSENNFSLWTTYDVSKLIAVGPGKTTVGGGVTYADGYFIQNTNIGWIPHTLSIDGLISYEYDNWRLALNGYNLTDEINYSSSQSSGMGGRAVVAPGRAYVFSVGKRF